MSLTPENIINSSLISTSKFRGAKDRADRRMILSISVYLLGKEKMKDTYWTIASCSYKVRENQLLIGITTVDNKLGTTLKNMRSHALDLAHFIKDQGLTPKVPRIQFFVYKQEEQSYLEKLKELIDTVEQNLNTVE
jgi:hypothetical protein